MLKEDTMSLYPSASLSEADFGVSLNSVWVCFWEGFWKIPHIPVSAVQTLALQIKSSKNGQIVDETKKGVHTFINLTIFLLF